MSLNSQKLHFLCGFGVFRIPLTPHSLCMHTAISSFGSLRLMNVKSQNEEYHGKGHHFFPQQYSQLPTGSLERHEAATRQHIQLFRERLSEKEHATIPKGIVGGFEGTVYQRSLKGWYGRPRTYVCQY